MPPAGKERGVGASVPIVCRGKGPFSFVSSLGRAAALAGLPQASTL